MPPDFSSIDLKMTDLFKFKREYAKLLTALNQRSLRCTPNCLAHTKRDTFIVIFVLNTMRMERIVNLHIEKLPEGFYLATSDNLQGLIAQGRTIAETIEIAKDVAKKLIEAQEEQIPQLKMVSDSFDYPMVISV